MQPKAGQKCATCVHWRGLIGVNLFLPFKELDAETAECHCYPPVVMPDGRQLRPVMLGADECGQHSSPIKYKVSVEGQPIGVDFGTHPAPDYVLWQKAQEARE